MPLRSRRPGKLPADYRGSGRSGNLVRSLVGGMLTGGGGAVVPDTEAVAEVAANTPFTDSTFDAGTVNRFKPASPFKNFMSGGAGTDRANELNVNAQLDESDALRQQHVAETAFDRDKELTSYSKLLDLLSSKELSSHNLVGQKELAELHSFLNDKLAESDFTRKKELGNIEFGQRKELGNIDFGQKKELGSIEFNRQKELANFENQLAQQYDRFKQELGLEGTKKQGQQKAEQIGRTFRSFQAQNPDFSPGFNVSPALSDIGIGELLSAAAGENLGQGFIAGIPTARATGAGQGNIATVEQNKANFLPALTRALQTLNVNTANAEAAGSARPDFQKAVQDAQFEKLRSIGVGNDAASRFTVNPNQAVIGREGVHKGPIFRTANKPIMFEGTPTGQMSKEEELVSDYSFRPNIPVDPSLINPNPPPVTAAPAPAARAMPVAPFQQQGQTNSIIPPKRRRIPVNNPPWTYGLDLRNVH